MATASTTPVRRFALTLARSGARQTAAISSACAYETALAAGASLRPNAAAVAAAVARSNASPCELQLSAAGVQRGGDKTRRAALLAAIAASAIAVGASTAVEDGALADGGGAALCEGAVSSQQRLLNPREIRGHYALFNEIGRGGTLGSLPFLL